MKAYASCRLQGASSDADMRLRRMICGAVNEAVTGMQ